MGRSTSTIQRPPKHLSFTKLRPNLLSSTEDTHTVTFVAFFENQHKSLEPKVLEATLSPWN